MYISISIYLYLSINVSIYQSVLSIYLSMYLSIYLSIYKNICPALAPKRSTLNTRHSTLKQERGHAAGGDGEHHHSRRRPNPPQARHAHRIPIPHPPRHGLAPSRLISFNLNDPCHTEFEPSLRNEANISNAIRAGGILHKRVTLTGFSFRIHRSTFLPYSIISRSIEIGNQGHFQKKMTTSPMQYGLGVSS